MTQESYSHALSGEPLLRAARTRLVTLYSSFFRPARQIPFYCAPPPDKRSIRTFRSRYLSTSRLRRQSTFGGGNSYILRVVNSASVQQIFNSMGLWAPRPNKTPSLVLIAPKTRAVIAPTPRLPGRVQVLSNLLSNAARHSRESSPITVTAVRGDTHVLVSVSDEAAALPSRTGLTCSGSSPG